MFGDERDTLRVDVPVGFLLPGPREIAVSVDRPSDTALSIRLRLIPAQTADPPAPPPELPPDPATLLDPHTGTMALLMKGRDAWSVS